MKKVIIVLLAITISLLIIKNQREEIVIPNTAIRLRVIPNSNSPFDQKMKLKVKNYLENNTYRIIKEENSINEARKIIKESIPNIEKNIDMIFKKNNYNMNYKVEYGNNYFPEKEYRDVKYPEGYYESIVISIGKAEGDNWWCVLFPNLCLVDLENKKETEYKSWIKEKLNKIF